MYLCCFFRLLICIHSYFFYTFAFYIELFMSNWSRLEQVISHLGLNVNSFAKEIGLNRSERLYQIKKGNYAISKNLVKTIISRYPEINDVWLLTGEGGMLRAEDKGAKISLYNIDIADLSVDRSSLSVTEYLEVPMFADSDFAIVNRGNAMSPEIKHGNLVFLKEIDINAVILGEIYLLLSDKINVLRIIRGLDDTNWRLVAINAADFDDLVVDKRSIRAVYKLKGVIAMKQA